MAAESPVRLYEGLFLLSQTAAGDLPGSLELFNEIFKRAEAEVVILRKWDERKLAYSIHGQKRGVYIIAYFKVRSTKLASIDRDCNLSEKIARHLIIEADFAGETELELAKRETTLNVEAKLRGPTDTIPPIDVMDLADAEA